MNEPIKENEFLVSLANSGREWKDAQGRIHDDEETLLALRAFGALYWSTDDIAEWFGITDLAWWQGEVANRMSWISRTIRQGELQQRAKVELNILAGAINGNQDDVDTYRRMMRDKSFALSKMDLFGGADDEALWQRIQNYIAKGSPGTLSAKEQNYLDLLNLIFSLDAQFGKRNVVRFLTKEPFCFTHAQATNLYAEAVELFHANRKVSRDALRDKTADMYDTLYHAAIRSAKNAADFALAADILTKKTKLLRLDEESVQKLDPTVYQRMPTVVSLDPHDIGLEPANRRVLGEIINKLPVSSGEKARLCIDGGLTDLDVEKYLSDESQEAS